MVLDLPFITEFGIHPKRWLAFGISEPSTVSMVQWYIYLYTDPVQNQPNVGTYTIYGWYGFNGIFTNNESSGYHICESGLPTNDLIERVG